MNFSLHQVKACIMVPKLMPAVSIKYAWEDDSLNRPKHTELYEKGLQKHSAYCYGNLAFKGFPQTG